MNISDLQMILGWTVSVATIWAYIQVKLANIFKELEWIKRTYAHDKAEENEKQKQRQELTKSLIEEIKKINSKINRVAEDMAILKTKLEVAECWKPAKKRTLK